MISLLSLFIIILLNIRKKCLLKLKRSIFVKFMLVTSLNFLFHSLLKLTISMKPNSVLSVNGPLVLFSKALSPQNQPILLFSTSYGIAMYRDCIAICLLWFTGYRGRSSKDWSWTNVFQRNPNCLLN